jgi:hypothetical protein
MSRDTVSFPLLSGADKDINVWRAGWLSESYAPPKFAGSPAINHIV